MFRFVTEDELPPDTDPTPDPEPDPEPLVQNTDARVQQANFNVIEGTEARDDISGTGAADYIIAGGGPDFFVKGGAGKDTFEVNYGDEIVRIADFEVGQDVIALEDRSVLDDATAQEANGRLDVRLPDDTLIRVDGLTLADMEGAFVFRFVTEDELPPDTDPTPDPEPDPEPLVQNTDARVQQANFNVIEGTEARDDISGTGAADYIIAGGGPDFFVKGGAGKDTFEVNYGDEIVRIADFEVGQDVIALEDRSVLDDATAQEANGRLDVRLSDDTLIRVDGLTLADMEGAFVFRFVTEDELPPDTDPTPDPEPDPTPSNTDLKIVIFGGQSLAFGAGGRDWVNTAPQYDNSLMLHFDNPVNSARGWGTDTVDAQSFNGFTPRVEVAQETPATGAMNLLAATHSDIDFISLHYGAGGQRLDTIREEYFPALAEQLRLLKDHADAQGYDIDPTIELAWIQGQAGTIGDYSDELSLHQDEVELAVKDIFGSEFELEFYTSITRGYGGKVITREQFDAIQDDPDIHIGATEVVFNSQWPDNEDIFNPHLSGEGYYMMGTQIASRILQSMEGDPLAPMEVASAVEVAPATYHVTFAGVQGELVEDNSVFSNEFFLSGPEHFGFDFYRTNDGRLTGEIVSSQIIDADTIELVYSEALDGEYRLWVGRSESDGWIDGAPAAGYGGTTLYDSAQVYTPVAPMDGLVLSAGPQFEYVPQQHFDFFA